MTDDRTCNEVAEVMDALCRGEFAGIAPERMEEAERHMLACTACAARVAGAPAVPDLEVPVPAVDAGSFDRVYDEVRARTPGGRRRFGRGWSVAAAILLSIAAWQVYRGARSPAWPMRLAGDADVTIESLEVFGDSQVMVFAASEGAGAVVWVLDEEDSR